MENCAKGWIESDARFGPVSETHGRYSVEVKVPSLFEDKTASWIRIVNGVEITSEKQCRSRRKKDLR